MTQISSPFTGTLVSLDDVNDEVFSERVMGEGVAVKPSEGRVVAPVTGTIAKLFEGGHGFAIETSEGLQVLVHVGLETVHLKGDGFTVRASEGQEINAGDEIVVVNLERMNELNIDIVSPVVVISGEAATVTETKDVKAGDPLLEVKAGG
ncbi:MAG: PTS glucose transporter subunit IIA [Actinomycetota bacterium]|nr:PTS glucose transporter subunit IIA [Actinomycetota bacterium]